MILRWAPLQVSAHILQNLLLWWNLSATLRGCASFFLESVRIEASLWQRLRSARTGPVASQNTSLNDDRSSVRPVVQPLSLRLDSHGTTYPLRLARHDDESAILARRARTDLPGESGREIAKRDKSGETKQSAQSLSRGPASEFTQTAILTAVKASRRDRG